MERFNRECRHFNGYRPCLFHKKDERSCWRCPDVAPEGTSILLIKLGSAGDVLRTTAILPGLHKMYPRMVVTWVTHGDNEKVLFNNPYIDRIVPYGTWALSLIQTARYDLVINLDVTPESSALCALAGAGLKKGYSLDSKGKVYPLSEAAARWYDMSLDDPLKRANTRTYQDMMNDIAGVPGNRSRPVLVLGEDALKKAGDIFTEKGIGGDRPVVGINTGGAGRWNRKSPGASKWTDVIMDLSGRVEADIMVFGGPRERDKYGYIMKKVSGRAVGSGTRNAFDVYAAMIGMCRVLVTPDTLGLHVAAALGTRTVALFGPTSSPEIGLYGEGRKILPEAECLSCYEERCDRVPDCMDMLPVDAVTEAVKELLDEDR